MTEVEQLEQETEKKGGGKKKVFFLVAIIAAIVGALMFWRTRKGIEDDEFEDDEL
jgi:hypothetical protein